MTCSTRPPSASSPWSKSRWSCSHACCAARTPTLIALLASANRPRPWRRAKSSTTATCCSAPWTIIAVPTREALTLTISTGPFDRARSRAASRSFGLRSFAASTATAAPGRRLLVHQANKLAQHLSEDGGLVDLIIFVGRPLEELGQADLAVSKCLDEVVHPSQILQRLFDWTEHAGQLAARAIAAFQDGKISL